MEDEDAKRVHEVAKGVSRVLDASGVGGFLAESIKAPLQEPYSIPADNLKRQLLENKLDIQVRVTAKLQTLGDDPSYRRIPLAVRVPLLEAASLVEEADLRERWANLIVNFANASSGVTIHKSFVTVLQELSPLEVVILDKIYSLPDAEKYSILTGNLPEFAAREPEPVKGQPAVKFPMPPPEVQLAIANLFRLNCISSATAWGGGEILDAVYTTTFGRELVRACTLRASEG